MGATQQLLQHVGGTDNLLAGAKEAYKFLALRFADSFCPIPKDLLCSKLHSMLDEVDEEYKKSEVRAKVHFSETDLEAELVAIWTEKGKGNNDENVSFFENLVQWLNPTAEEGRRVVAAIKFTSLERFELVAPPRLEGNKWLQEIAQASKKIHTHYWVFESDLGYDGNDDLEWRVRCINMAMIPQEGSKIV